MEEKTIKERLAALTEPEAGEAAASKAKGGKSGKGKASTAGGGKDAEEEGEGKEGLVKYLPAAHREAVQALVEAAEGKRGRPPVRAGGEGGVWGRGGEFGLGGGLGLCLLNDEGRFHNTKKQKRGQASGKGKQPAAKPGR